VRQPLLHDRITEDGHPGCYRHGACPVSSDPANLALPLAGVRIIDISEGIAGPYATSLLADMGADVIKIERPDGDWSRFVGLGVADGLSAMYVAVNRNKREITVDLKNQDAVDLVRELVEGSAAVVSNYRAGVMERLGLSYEECLAIRPGVVYCTITAFDTEGHYARVGGNDTGLQAISGFMSMNGQPGGEPLRAATPVIDMISSLFVSNSILAALRLPDDHSGRRVEVSLLNAAAAMQTIAFTEYLNTGVIPVRQGNSNPFIAPAGAFAGSDGNYFTVSCLKESHWQRLCETVGREDLLADPRFLDNGQRVQNRTSLDAQLSETFANRPASEWVDVLRERDVLCAAINDLEAVMADSGLGGVLPLINVGSTQALQTVGHPVRFGGHFPKPYAGVQRIGTDSRATLTQLGYGKDRIASLVASGAVISRADEELSTASTSAGSGDPENETQRRTNG
jgi:CoA:oxalate CoA-transferase